jgi:hypothetical protein
MWDEKRAFIARISGENFVRKLFQYFNPEDLSRWIDEPPLNFIRNIRFYIKQAVGFTETHIEELFKTPNFRSVKDFDLSEDFRLERIMILILADCHYIRASINMLEVYWQMFLSNPEEQFHYKVATPLNMLEEVVLQIKVSNLRIKQWTEYLVNHSAIGTVTALDVNENTTFRHITEVIVRDVSVIEVITATSEKFIELKKKES